MGVHSLLIDFYKAFEFVDYDLVLRKHASIK